MIKIDMEMPLDCQGCRFCSYAESAHRCGNVCTATEDWNPLDGEYDKPNWCPLKEEKG